MTTQTTTFKIVAAVSGTGAIDQLKRSINEASSSGDKLKRSFATGATALKAFAASAVAAAAVQLGRQMVSAADDTQRLQLRLETLTGSSQKAAEAYNYLFQASQKLGVETLSLADSYSKLLPLVNAGVLSTSDARKILEGLGDTAAATGASTERLNDVFYGLGQALGSGRVQAEELNQVTEPLPGLLNNIADAAGVTVGQFRQMVKDGEVTSEMFKGLLIDALKKYEGAASKTADTVSGSAQRLANAWRDLSSSLGSSLTPAVVELNKFLAVTIERFNALFAIGNQGKLDNLTLQIGTAIDSYQNAQLELSRAQEEATRLQGSMFQGFAEGRVANAKKMADKYLDEYNRLVRAKSDLQAQLSTPPDDAKTNRPTPPSAAEAKQGEKIKEALADANASLEAARRLSAARAISDEAAKRTQATIEAENEARRLGISITSAQGQELVRLAQQQAEVEIQSDRREKAQKEAEQATARAGRLAARGAQDRERDLRQSIETMDTWLAKQREELETLQLEREFIGKTAIEVEKLKDARKLETDFIEQTKGLTPELIEGYRQQVEVLKELRQQEMQRNYDASRTFQAGAQGFFKSYVEDATNAAEQTRQALENAFSGMEDALVEFTTTGKLNFKDFANSIIKDIARILVRQSITGPLASTLGGLFSGGFGGIFGGGAAAGAASSGFTFGGGLAFANGGVMTSRGAVPLRKYAAGGVANSPQLALYGEGSRPEAFVPLPDGRRIPVALQGGGGTNVNVIVNMQTGQTETRGNDQSGRDLGNLIASAVKSILINEKRPGGLLAA